MQGHRAGNCINKDVRPSLVFTIPPDLRHQLAAWIDMDALGADGFWLWLGTVLPLLPSTVTTGAGPGSATQEQRSRKLDRNLVDCARECVRLNVMCERYYTDNQSLAHRLKALEATLRTFERAGGSADISDYPVSTAAVERYLKER